MNTTQLLRAGALLAGLAVALGAFGAHGLKESLDAADLAIFETGVRYQMFHALGLLACAALAARGVRLGLGPWAILGGTVVFSGSLYLLVLLDLRWLGAVTPFGGAVMILGWLALAFARPAGAADAS